MNFGYEDKKDRDEYNDVKMEMDLNMKMKMDLGLKKMEMALSSRYDIQSSMSSTTIPQI